MLFRAACKGSHFSRGKNDFVKFLESEIGLWNLNLRICEFVRLRSWITGFWMLRCWILRFRILGFLDLDFVFLMLNFGVKTLRFSSLKFEVLEFGKYRKE